MHLAFGVAMACTDSFCREKELCLACGSSGVFDADSSDPLAGFVRCRTCCEPYHLFCANFNR